MRKAHENRVDGYSVFWELRWSRVWSTVAVGVFTLLLLTLRHQLETPAILLIVAFGIYFVLSACVHAVAYKLTDNQIIANNGAAMQINDLSRIIARPGRIIFISGSGSMIFASSFLFQFAPIDELNELADLSGATKNWQ